MSTKLPDFALQERKYNRAVARGRHPRSFQRDSELFYYCRNTSNRLKRIASGHSFWRVVDEECASDEAAAAAAGEDDANNSLFGGSSTQSVSFQEGSTHSISSSSRQNNRQQHLQQQQHSASSSSLLPHINNGSISNHYFGGGGVGSTHASSSSSLHNKAAVVAAAQIAALSAAATGGGNPETVPPAAAAAAGVGAATPATNTRFLINFALNGVQIDVRGHQRVHYGMLIVLMNHDASEVICVNNRNEVRVKLCTMLLPTDRICFKLLDLRDLTSPAEVEAGGPVWFQMVETPKAGDDMTKAVSDWNTSVCLATKIFSLFTLETSHLDPKWEKSEKRQVLQRESKQRDKSLEVFGDEDDNEEVDEFGGTGGGGGGGIDSPGGSTGTTSKNGSNNNSPSKLSPSKKAASSRDGGNSNTTIANDGAEVCGLVIALKLAMSKTNMFGEETGYGDETSRYNSRESYSFGQFVVHSAARHKKASSSEADGAKSTKGKGGAGAKSNDSKTEQDGEEAAAGGGGEAAGGGDAANEGGLRMNTPLMMTQDLYCLASSQGTDYDRWPMRGEDIQRAIRQASSPTKGIKGKKKVHGERANGGADEDEEDEEARGGAMSKGGGTGSGDGGKGKGGGGKGGLKGGGGGMGSSGKSGSNKRGKSMAELEEGYKGVLRRIVERGEQYEYVVDRKCVWRMCMIENLSDTSSLSVAEIASQKLISKAKATLRKSEMQRKGAKVYDAGSGLFGANMAISGGEAFPRTLRKSVSKHLLENETFILEQRRLREQHGIRGHFASLLTNWDRGDASDDISVACSTSMNSLHSSRSGAGGGGPGAGLAQRSLTSQVSRLSDYGGGGLQQHQHNSNHGGGGSIGADYNYDDGAAGEGEEGDDETRGSSNLLIKRVLPPDHRERYEQEQQRILHANTRVIDERHYQRYPHYYKEDPDAEQNLVSFGFNDPSLTDGQKVASVHQALTAIAAKVNETFVEQQRLEAERIASGAPLVDDSMHIGIPIAEKQKVKVSKGKLGALRAADDLVWQALSHVERVESMKNVKHLLSSNTGTAQSEGAREILPVV